MYSPYYVPHDVYITAIPPMVNHAKQVALNPRDNNAANKWRDVNDELLNAVRSVGDAITGVPSVHPSQLNHHQVNHQQVYSHPPPQPQQSYYNQQRSRQQSATPSFPTNSYSVLQDVQARAPSQDIIHNRVIVREEIPAPPRPPPPVEISPPPRPPPPPEVDEEEETRAFWERYPLPAASGIFTAAHSLHQVKLFKNSSFKKSFNYVIIANYFIFRNLNNGHPKKMKLSPPPREWLF